MPGTKGQIQRSRDGKGESIYLSDKLGLWLEGQKLHVTFLGKQDLHTNLTEADGLLFDVMAMLYRHGMRVAARDDKFTWKEGDITFLPPEK